LLLLPDSITNSLSDKFFGTTELIAETTKSFYLSFVSVITTAGLTLVLFNSEKGNGIKIISPILIVYLVFW